MVECKICFIIELRMSFTQRNFEASQFPFGAFVVIKKKIFKFYDFMPNKIIWINACYKNSPFIRIYDTFVHFFDGVMQYFFAPIAI